MVVMSPSAPDLRRRQGTPPMLPTPDGETVVPTSPLLPPLTPGLLCEVEETAYRAIRIKLDLQCPEDAKRLQNRGSPG